MLSKAKGIVAIDPKYVPAKNGKDSYIYFRLGCELVINSKKTTEFYTIKAFGKVADFLRNTIKKDSEVYLEALARSCRYTKNDVDQVRIEFHAFMVRDVATNLFVDTRVNNAEPQQYVELNVNTVAQPTSHANETKAKYEAEMKWQKISDNDVKSVASKFRQIFEEQKRRVFGTTDLPTPLPKSDSKTVTPSFSGIKNRVIRSVYPGQITCSETTKIMAARDALVNRITPEVFTHNNGNYADIRNG